MKDFEIKQLFKSKQITFSQITQLLDKSDFMLFNIDDKYLLRLSKHPQNENAKLKLIQHIKYAPVIIDSGKIDITSGDWYYSILTYQKGSDLYDAFKTLNKKQVEKIASQICIFMDQIHSVTNDCYDVGLYIPTIKNTKSSWKEGHQQYIDWLQKNISSISLSSIAKESVNRAFNYLDLNLNALDYQTGPVLLHNDLHLKNIIINRHELSGIIDFECAQYGERDFELTHLVHWSLFPKVEHHLYTDFIIAVVKQFQIKNHIDQLDIRLTIYQLEHEIAQLIWNNGDSELERVNRINHWLNGIITELFNALEHHTVLE